MKRLIVFLAAVVAAAAMLGAFPATVPADDRVPYKGRADEVTTSIEPAPDGLHITVAVTGQATHMGRFTGDENVVGHADGTFAGTRVFIAANGDQLFANVEGRPISPNTAGGTFTFTGGTGRFRNAAGGADFVGVSSDGFIHIAITFEGTIRF
jgi:hypothetical protein